ncbi:TetR/AcrR family transcriptional regulator [Quadrisphaera sp. DSM 44207]|uniref:TetR/AcrR family transcriptional regulator n=1 Tax=Quadrisphaera sp. DSM 44207 TaxID=1881057 RepID=UPI000886DAA6|nr:TetR/AcrR family transcriptional regulator [Quadrisphaera sp. DSM 44207]SDQ08721.1 transcriptional regulator, TetR family [Quadrisphaera sp. DSM 44207]
MPRAGLSHGAVVDAAERLADEVGLSNLTLTALAQDLGVRQPSLYKHVEGVAHLRRSLAVRAKAELAGVLASAATGVAGAEAVHALAAAYRDWGRAHPGRYAAAQRAPAPDDEEDAAASAAVVAVVVRVLASLGVPDADAVHATRALRAALHGFLVLETEGAFRLPDDVDVSFRRTVDCLVLGLRPHPAPS